MHWAVAASIGLAGAWSAEAVEVQLFIRRERRVPWSRARGRATVVNGERYPPLRYYLLATLLRGVAAAMFVGVYGASNQVSGVIGAFTLGVGASVAITRIADLKEIGTLPGSVEVPPPVAATSEMRRRTTEGKADDGDAEREEARGHG
jgi:hypothetical protein